MEERLMKKSNFVALVMGTISMVFFALGMCMAMLPEWNAFEPGIGMCLTMVWANMILGIIIGLAGIVVLLMLIPLCKGIRD